MDIQELINLQMETEFLDYKLKIDFQHNKVDFLRDIIAFSNNSYEGDQYIIYGIMEKENGIGVVGLEDFNYGDDADYHTLISDKIEPNIGVEFIKQIYQDKKILVVRINANKMLRPFVVKSKYTQNKNILDVGESWVRLGSSKKKMVRSDFENIYMRRRSPLGLRLRDNNLFINDLGIAQLELLITNTSDFDRVFTEAFLSIEDHNGKQLTILRMMKFTSRWLIQEGSFYSDFTLNIPRKSEIHGIAEFSFSSTQAIIIGLSEYGDSEEKYIFRVKFRFDVTQEYLYSFNDCTVFARGKGLWKMQEIAKDNKKKRKQ